MRTMRLLRIITLHWLHHVGLDCMHGEGLLQFNSTRLYWPSNLHLCKYLGTFENIWEYSENIWEHPKTSENAFILQNRIGLYSNPPDCIDLPSCTFATILGTSQNILRTPENIWEHPENIQEHLRTHLLYHLSIGFEGMQLYLIVLTFQLAPLQISACHDHQL